MILPMKWQLIEAIDAIVFSCNGTSQVESINSLAETNVTAWLLGCVR